MLEIYEGDCIALMDSLKASSVDVIIADPPYYVDSKTGLIQRPEGGIYSGVTSSWDRYDNLDEFLLFTEDWLRAARRILKRGGTIWVHGKIHLHFVGAEMLRQGYFILNDIVWIKSNPPPNFRGVRFCSAHEGIIWAVHTRGDKYTFNYHLLKQENGGKQMRSDWYFPICIGKERLRDKDGKVLHQTQKPLALVDRMVKASTQPGDLIFDPFMGLGTAAIVAIQNGCNYIGVDINPDYIGIALERINNG